MPDDVKCVWSQDDADGRPSREQCGALATSLSCVPYVDAPTCADHKYRCAKPIGANDVKATPRYQELLKHIRAAYVSAQTGALRPSVWKREGASSYTVKQEQLPAVAKVCASTSERGRPMPDDVKVLSDDEIECIRDELASEMHSPEDEEWGRIWLAALDAERAKVVEAESERDELRALLVASVPEELVCSAEMRCPSCGDGLVARLGTELKLQADRAVAERDAERAKVATLTKERDEALKRWGEYGGIVSAVCDHVSRSPRVIAGQTLVEAIQAIEAHSTTHAYPVDAPKRK